MSNGKPREVKRAVESELQRSRQEWAGAIQDQPRFLLNRSSLPSDCRRVENNDLLDETFTLPLEAARLKVRAIIDDIPKRGYQKIVERWRRLSDGQIQFTMRRVPVVDEERILR